MSGPMCKYDAQGIFNCGGNSRENSLAAKSSKVFEPFSIASNAVMAYSTNKCPDDYQSKPLQFVQQESNVTMTGFDPMLSAHQPVTQN